MPKPITQAQPPLEFIPPAFNPAVYRFLKLVLPLWTRWRLKIVDVQVNHLDTLIHCYQRFQAGELRFMVAFRHPSTNDPFCLFNLLDRQLPKMARQQGIALKLPVYAHFMYDRGIPLWAGKTVGWLLRHLGCTSIRRGKLDLMGLRSAREIYAEGRFPIAAAPEGATNGHNEIVSPLEPGIAQLSFWCVEDLRKADRNEEVWIVPIGVQYRYVSPPWEAIEQLLSTLEADCGLPPYDAASLNPTLNIVEQGASLSAILSNPQELLLYKRLLRLSEHLLTSMEQFYSKFYHQNLRPSTLPENPTDAASDDRISPANHLIGIRLQTLLNGALSVSEDYFGVPGKGNFADRCRRLEQASWDWIYREDLKELEDLSPVDRGLADRIAEESAQRLWHMRLVESFVSVTGHYILEKPTADRFAETLLLLYDTVNKIKGRFYAPRPRLGQQRAELTVGEPIAVSDRWADYKTSRRSAVATLTQDLQVALEKLIL
ncbi:MAG: 1-acyl-sn-glycerol-3-phosphate acyltransferase [Drouetiella hepatica Uher 2000/2452]|uniref:1-acyl-sn-glycerol-3-phosphate acyltransferase n=1 Tax=Drouetiella hepatica Uher 2000/2452 TaxID=904376 RepID=A0A951UMJ5_9CYAN|nr:1-acyl-sn-glycerol-3-phosphate acyltransferase [Drouetiella hepatica Uher 2000/2452]